MALKNIGLRHGIRDPGYGKKPYPGSGVKKTPDHGSESATIFKSKRKKTTHVTSLTCSSLVCKVEMYPIAPPRNMNMIQKARFLHSFAMVPRKGRRFDSTAEAALGDGGVGGSDDRTPHTVRKKPGRAGRNQTRFRRGMSSGLVTRRGVRDWPSTRPKGLDMPRMRVARVRSDSPNQFWLTCVESKTVSLVFSVMDLDVRKASKVG